MPFFSSPPVARKGMWGLLALKPPSIFLFLWKGSSSSDFTPKATAPLRRGSQAPQLTLPGAAIEAVSPAHVAFNCGDWMAKILDRYLAGQRIGSRHDLFSNETLPYFQSP